jgi:hypothetical protein
MAGGVFVELLLQLGAGNLFAEHLDQQFDDLRFAEAPAREPASA